MMKSVLMRISRVLGLIVLMGFMLSNVSLKAQENVLKETFKVWGNCDMCKSTIEKSLKSIKGVKSGKWNVASGKMTVKYDSSKIDLDEIKKAIAAVGYDTEAFKAPDAVYEKLHHCCQYDRSKK